MNIFKLFQKRQEPAMFVSSEVQRFVNVNAIADGIEKANAVLVALHSGETGRYNENAIATWERIRAALRTNWKSAMIEVQTDGYYTFE